MQRPFAALSFVRVAGAIVSAAEASGAFAQEPVTSARGPVSVAGETFHATHGPGASAQEAGGGAEAIIPCNGLSAGPAQASDSVADESAHVPFVFGEGSVQDGASADDDSAKRNDAVSGNAARVRHTRTFVGTFTP